MAITPDLVRRDLELPREDGLATRRHLRVQPATAAIPVIASTASGAARDPARGTPSGTDLWHDDRRITRFVQILVDFCGKMYDNVVRERFERKLAGNCARTARVQSATWRRCQ
ncbi:hypothetical protein [Accumulibacter sp.]|uniref:hypothetical protein n=1 Tax=Accumulibacter sp. TaxID=2053492 RepID=UPI0025D28D9C|nr:hypothetical protein [Accumulibacter sp.]MCM8613857.1 hypothetical protein [Accumulibacter sp.]MCM8637489.1 hypothetical protein [Accumulibacter sp.]MCM8640977.1 hypothetical protein [Accumulibacter sp.]